MRSRYAAYAKGLADYIISTTDPEGSQWQENTARWAEEITAFSQRTQFKGLVIVDAPTPTGDIGQVTFQALLVRGGEDVGFTEVSAFRRHQGRWLYVDAAHTT
jgi:SEC-C motif-containing protein